MGSFYTCLKSFLLADDGPTSVEYAVMLGLIISVCVGTISTLGVNASTVCNMV